MSEYEDRGALKIKGDSGIKKRKKKNDKKKLLEQVSKVAEVKKEEKFQVNVAKWTKAELAFQKMQEKMACYNKPDNFIFSNRSKGKKKKSP